MKSMAIMLKHGKMNYETKTEYINCMANLMVNMKFIKYVLNIYLFII